MKTDNFIISKQALSARAKEPGATAHTSNTYSITKPLVPFLAPASDLQPHPRSRLFEHLARFSNRVSRAVP
jgi:hypothetical protein